MKKSLKIMFSILICLCPILLTACGSVDYYTITAISSDTTIGSVTGFRDDAVAEGTKITLSARETDEQNNPLLCWIKDKEKIVKVANHTEEERDLDFEVISKAENEGQYTAVFAENEIRYACIKGVEFTSTGEETYEHEISYAILNAGSNNYLPFATHQDNTHVLYFGNIEQKNQFKFMINATQIIGESSNSATDYNETIIDETSFIDGEASIEFTFDFDGDLEKETTCTITFAQLNAEVLANITMEQE